MSDVDAILRRGTYTDRRGQFWHYGGAVWSAYGRLIPGHFQSRTPDQMRRLIVRDLHRAECPGLGACGDHPVVTVSKGAYGGWVAFPLRSNVGHLRLTFAEAIAAAHNMTGEK